MGGKVHSTYPSYSYPNKYFLFSFKREVDEIPFRILDAPKPTINPTLKYGDNWLAST
jgi:hypothetical protein